MSQVAIDKDELELFTPDSLKNLVPPPIFRLRAATKRDAMRYDHMLSLEGLRIFRDDDVRPEILRTLKANWDEETYAKNSVKLETFWAKLDQEITPDPAEAQAVAELTARCLDVSPFLRRMDADNKRFHANAPIIALGLYLAGWKNIDVPFRLDSGYVPYETLTELREALFKLEEQAKAENVEGVMPGFGFLQLTLKGYQLLQLTGEEEKNSSAPSPSSETPNGSQTTTTADGASETTNSKPTKTPRARRPRGQKSS
jgi:hypothetical protein